MYRRITHLFMLSLLSAVSFAVSHIVVAKESPTDITTLPPVVVEVLTKTTKSWGGSLLPPYTDGQPEVTILRITIAPNAQVPWHKHPVINAAVMLTGELTVVMEGDKKTYLNAGDAIVEVVDQWHYGINEGAEPVELIVFYAGVAGVPLSIHRTTAEHQ